ncbi:MAG TPA: isoprenylcysteine carboxylmethyltransferase family protein [Acetobacteraceae bacterium]|nr:isoprenylcysteine carboxylmethyltransferase family protein [Acetobacteraceae bacterium]
MHPGQLLAGTWIVWVVSWIVAGFWSARTEKRATTGVELLHRAITILGFLLIAFHIGRPPAWPVGNAASWTLAFLAVAGFFFTWWARTHLGRFWSSAIVRKEGHQIIKTGPYALVRHPIYTGLILAILATAASRARPTSLAGAALATIGLWLKARTEERFLAKELGAEAYAEYRRRVPMLLPLPRL